MSLAGAFSSDRLLDRIERRNALKSFAGDRRAAAFGDVEESSAQMRPTEGKHDRLAAGCIGNGLVGGVSIALHDAAIVIEQLERMNRAAPRSVAVRDGWRVGPAPRPVVPRDGPEVSLFGASAGGIEHRRRGLIDRDLAGGQNEF